VERIEASRFYTTARDVTLGVRRWWTPQANAAGGPGPVARDVKSLVAVVVSPRSYDRIATSC
jgi:hypothetical protein